MSWILRSIKRYFKYGVKPHVRFSNSTLSTERERMMRNIASPIPFQNFVNEVRLTAMDEHGTSRMSLKDSAYMRRSAMRMWATLTEEQKNKYRTLAINSNETRLPLSSLIDSKSHIQLPSIDLLEKHSSQTALVPVCAVKKKPRCRRPTVRLCSIMGNRRLCSIHGRKIMRKAQKPKRLTKKLPKKLPKKAPKKPAHKCIKRTVRRSSTVSTPVAVQRVSERTCLGHSHCHLGKRRYSETDLHNASSSTSSTSRTNSNFATHTELLALAQCQVHGTESRPLHEEVKRRRRE